MSTMATEGTEFVQLELPVPKDRFGNKATKLILQISNWEPRLTIEDDLETFTKIQKGRYVELTVRGYIHRDLEDSASSEDGEDTVEMRKALKVLSVEIA